MCSFLNKRRFGETTTPRSILSTMFSQPDGLMLVKTRSNHARRITYIAFDEASLFSLESQVNRELDEEEAAIAQRTARRPSLCQRLNLRGLRRNIKHHFHEAGGQQLSYIALLQAITNLQKPERARSSNVDVLSCHRLPPPFPTLTIPPTTPPVPPRPTPLATITPSHLSPAPLSVTVLPSSSRTPTASRSPPVA